MFDPTAIKPFEGPVQSYKQCTSYKAKTFVQLHPFSSHVHALKTH